MGNPSWTSTLAPHPLLTNPHAMTLFSRFWPRLNLLKGIPKEERLFQVGPESKILAECNWQIDRKQRPVLILVHGLEGCTRSHYMIGIAHKAWHAGLNIVRINQRNCGGTEHLTSTLYNGGLSSDVSTVVNELVSKDEIPSVWIAGYSMGGNLVLRMAGEVGNSIPALCGVAAVCPNINPAICVETLQRKQNWIYHWHFLTRLKARLKRKAAHYPGKYDLSLLPSILTLTDFDNAYTAPDGGYTNAMDYYERTGARHVLKNIRVPTLIITAQDDPFIPYHTFNITSIHANPYIRLVAPLYGGHCGFFQRTRQTEDHYWAENRILDFIRNPETYP